jgi:hypothetical protein
MANLVNVRKDALTETFTYDDNTEETVDRTAYIVGELVHTEDCLVTTRIESGSGPKGAKEVKLANALEEISSGSLTECESCGLIRKVASEPNSATSTEAMNDTKESEAVPSKTLTKIELPDSLKEKTTPTILAVVKFLEETDASSYTTGEVAKAAEVNAAAVNSALLALESAGVVVHTDSGSGTKKVRTWSRKGARPAKKTAADYKAVMEAKPKAAPKAPPQAKAATAPAAKKAAPASATGRVSVGARQEKALEYLKKHPNVPKSVLHIEEGCGYPVKTLAGVLARMAEREEFPIVRADTDAGRRGFMYVPPPKKK